MGLRRELKSILTSLGKSTEELAHIQGLIEEAHSNNQPGKVTILKKRRKIIADKVKFYHNEAINYGHGKITTIVFTMVSSDQGINIPKEYEVNYINVTKEEAKQLIQLYAYGIGKVATIKEIWESTTLIRKL